MFGGAQTAPPQAAQPQNNMWMTNGNGKYKFLFLFISLPFSLYRKHYWFRGVSGVCSHAFATMIVLCYATLFRSLIFNFDIRRTSKWIVSREQVFKPTVHISQPVLLLCCFISIFYFWFVGFPAVPPANNNFVTDNSFSSVFGNQDAQSGKCSIRLFSSRLQDKFYSALFLSVLVHIVHIYIPPPHSLWLQTVLPLNTFYCTICILRNCLDS